MRCIKSLHIYIKVNTLIPHSKSLHILISKIFTIEKPMHFIISIKSIECQQNNVDLSIKMRALRRLQYSFKFIVTITITVQLLW